MSREWEGDGSIQGVSVIVLMVLCVRQIFLGSFRRRGSYSEYGNSVSEACDEAMVDCGRGRKMVIETF